MSIFNGYQKPGPGIAKNTGYEPNRFLLYFQLLGRKFWNLCVLNLVFVLFTIPFLALTVVVYKLLALAPFIGILGPEFHIPLSFLPFAFYGPVMSAVYKISWDFAREEPAFIFSDFVGTMKKNIKKPIALSFISYILFFALSFALPFYFAQGGIFVYVFFPLCLLATLVVFTMQHYIYTMAAVFDLSVKEMLRNALILTFACIGRTILLVLFFAFFFVFVVALLLCAFQYPIVFGFLFIFLVCFLFAYYYFTTAFVTHPILQKYIVEPYYQQNPQETSAVLKDSSLLKNDKDTPREIPEYVYHNGRMVHRSVLESENLFDDNRRIGVDKDE